MPLECVNYCSWNQLLVPPLESVTNIQGTVTTCKLPADTRAPQYATVADNADIHSKSPANLGLPSIVQDCTDSVPPLIDADISIVSRYMYSDCSLAGMHSVELMPLIFCAADRH